MMAMECHWENEIAEAIEDGRWPAACHADLVTHAASCAVCRDVDVGRLWFPIALAAGAWIVVAPLVLLVVLSDD